MDDQPAAPQGDQPASAHTPNFLEKYQFWIVGTLCAMALVYEIATGIMAPTPSEQLTDIGMMPFLEAAYDDAEALRRDLDAMDALGDASRSDAAAFLYDTIYPKIYTAYKTALINAPAKPLEDNYRLTMQMIDTARKEAPEVCRIALELDVNFADLPVSLAPDVLETFTTTQKARFGALAETIRASRETPTPLEIPVAQAVAAYDTAFGRVINQQRKDDLLQRAMAEKATPEETCELILMATQSVETVPDYQRVLILKGMMLAPYTQ